MINRKFWTNTTDSIIPDDKISGIFNVENILSMPLKRHYCRSV